MAQRKQNETFIYIAKEDGKEDIIGNAIHVAAVLGVKPISVEKACYGGLRLKGKTIDFYYSN